MKLVGKFEMKLFGSPLFILIEVLVIKCSLSSSCVKEGMTLRFFVHPIVLKLWSSCLVLSICLQKIHFQNVGKNIRRRNSICSHFCGNFNLPGTVNSP